MNKISRRKLITAGLAATAGVSGVAVAAGLARRYGLVPPDGGGFYGPGETLTYAAQRLLTRHSLAREFPRSMISKIPFANEIASLTMPSNISRPGGCRLAASGRWNGRPAVIVFARRLQELPLRSQITEVVCEEGWSYVAEWIGTPVVEVLNAAGILPQARYIVYFSIDRDWWESIDMADALHPQTLLTMGDERRRPSGVLRGPLRMRVPRQLGYKSVKFITRLTATDNLKGFGKGLGRRRRRAGYAWYAGI